MVACGSCGTENDAGRKFCSQCGAPLALSCPACGAPNKPSDRFCGECGGELQLAVAGTPAVQIARETPGEERRLVSVLFADLVGFTSLSESRDAEEVRELLSRYFDTCTTLIARFGGVVEKFIGDAVMAVWGSPVATEDDAERAVRAALDLVSAVEAFGAEVGATDLRARAGVLTGEAAVAVAATNQGMVAGDMVNTASRIQSIAQPGTVLVGDSTRSATATAIGYADAGTHELKGKAEPVQLWRALRVVGGEGLPGLEPPFVGRDRELRIVKETFHGSADEGRAHLVSIIGGAGSGKSRLAAEFSRYLDGLASDMYWHRGRCPAYGDGLTYWALSEMIRGRCRIPEEETGPAAMTKLVSMLDEELGDSEERRWIEPRLATLIGLEDGGSGDRNELFSAWRLFFERLADRHPVVLVFEDLQWADTSLLDFIEYLLEWSRNTRLFVMTLSRPELSERRPTWGAGQRNFTSIYLEPLSDDHVRVMLAGLVPGLPDDVERVILERAQGVPLYAVETTRMLLDRGLLVQEDSSFRLTGQIEELQIPETLHSLVAARLDGLLGEERVLVLDAAVLGKAFFKEGIAALAGKPVVEVQPVLDGLVRKEVLTLEVESTSPERGQYSFIHDFVRQIAYGTISKKDRKAKHLAAATFIRDGWQGDLDDVVEVVASHLLQAFELDPSAVDAPTIRQQALDMLRRAGERAASLGANHEAEAYFARAAGFADDDLDRASFLERAGDMALVGGRLAEAASNLRDALAVFESRSEAHAAARVSARLAEIDHAEGRLDEAVERMEKAFSVLSADEPDEDLATLAAQLGRLHLFRGDLDLAADRVDRALEIAEAMVLPEVLAQALNTKGILAGVRSRTHEEVALVGYALKVALEHDRTAAALRAYNNLAENRYCADLYEDSLELYREGIALARRVGNRFWLDQLLTEIPVPLFMLGRWDEALASAEERSSRDLVLADTLGQVVVLPLIHVNRGELDAAAALLDVYRRYETSPDVQERAAWMAGTAVLMNARADHEQALSLAEETVGTAPEAGADTMMVKVGLAEGVDAAIALGDLDRGRKILDSAQWLPSIRFTPVLAALVQRSRARFDALEGASDGTQALFGGAAGLFREIGVRFWLATTLTEQAESLLTQGRPEDAGPLFDEARGIFQALSAVTWLERLERSMAAKEA